MILTTDKMVFVTDFENSDEYRLTGHSIHHIINYFTNGKKASERLIIICFLQVDWKRLWII